MPRFGLTPQEIELKKVISARLNAQLAKTPYKKADVVRQTGISESTVYDYFNGHTLPSPESIDKLARFFHVDKGQLDPPKTSRATLQSTSRIRLIQTVSLRLSAREIAWSPTY